jgi:hypothetical protein
MALFVMTATRMNQVSERASLIQDFRRISGRDRSSLLKSVDSPLGKLRGFVSYIFSAFTMAKAFARGTGTILLRSSSNQFSRILADDFPYFRYQTDGEGLRLYYEYFGSPKLMQPHREVTLVITQATNPVDFAHVRINDVPTRYSLVRGGVANLILPFRDVRIGILSFSNGKEAILASALLAPTQWKVELEASLEAKIERRDFDTCLNRLRSFASGSGYDPELAALVALKEQDTREEEDSKQVRGGRFEQLVWELLQSMTPVYFDSAHWEGELDEDYGIPRHATGLKHDITITKGSDMMIVEVTLAGPTQQQGKDLSVQSHLTKERPNVKGILLGILVVTNGFYRQVLQNLGNDPVNEICPMILDEFLATLNTYRRDKDYVEFIKTLKSFRGRS